MLIYLSLAHFCIFSTRYLLTRCASVQLKGTLAALEADLEDLEASVQFVYFLVLPIYSSLSISSAPEKLTLSTCYMLVHLLPFSLDVVHR